MDTSKILNVEIKIMEALERENIILGLTAKLSVGFLNGKIENIIFYQNFSNKKKKKIFAKFDIRFSSVGFLCSNDRRNHNLGLPVEHSFLLQQLLRTIVEEALDEVLREVES